MLGAGVTTEEALLLFRGAWASWRGRHRVAARVVAERGLDLAESLFVDLVDEWGLEDSQATVVADMVLCEVAKRISTAR